MISNEDYLWFVGGTLDQIATAVEVIGDARVNERPELEGANTPYGIVTHCIGVMNALGGRFVAGREVARDRDAEFVASGSVGELLVNLGTARDQLVEDVASADPRAPLRDTVPGPNGLTPWGKSQGAALIHLFEELAQHLGQLEITRDLLLVTVLDAP